MSNGKPKKNKKKIFIIGGLVVLLLVVVGLVVFSGNKEDITSVQTDKVQKRTITETVSATGKIHPVFQVQLRPEVTGEIVELPVIEGQVVKKGQLLIRLKPDQYIARKNRAEASYQASKATLKVREATLVKVKSEYKRVKGLYAKRLASDKELESAKALFKQTEGQLEAQKSAVLQQEESFKDAKVELAKTVIYAPIDGVITVLNVELSERVLGSSFSQGTHLMTVADLSQMEARVDVDENDIVRIAKGDTANITIDAFGDKLFMGIVTQIGNSAQTTGLGSQDEVVNFEVRVRLQKPNPTIRPGMSCDTEIRTETKKNVISVPIQCVTARMPKFDRTKMQGKKGETNNKKDKNISRKKKPAEVVFLADANHAKMVKVKTGISDDSFIEITRGLEGGETVITGPYRAISKDLKDGVRIMVKKKKDQNNKKSMGDK